MSDAKKDAAPAAPAPKGSKMITLAIIVGVANLGGTGFLAFKSFVPPPAPAKVAAAAPGEDPHAAPAGGGEHGAEAEPAHAEEAQGGGHAEEAKEGGPSVEQGRPRAAGSGPAVTLDPFLVNLNEEESARYLKTTVEVELGSEYFAEGLKRSKSAVRDEVLRYLSSLSVADTLGEERKMKIRDAIAERIDKVLGRGSVRNVYYAEFVVQ